MSKTFHLTIARVGENLFAGEALSVTLPGSEGIFTVLAHHEAFVSQLKDGVIFVKTLEGTEQEIELVGTGLVEISDNQVTVLL
jgi:F-type H+-transporting ATPase subunit epsilon